jgi:hypothetical protein
MLTVAVGRALPGLIGDARQVHLFHPPNHYPWHVYALCGARYWSGDIEWLDLPASTGVCTKCLEVKADVEATP